MHALGDLADWQVEWKWDGIRAQLIRRAETVHLWSRGEELITHRFPEIAAAATHLPDGTVLDGEVLAFRDDRPLPFSALQQRIGRQKQVAQMSRAVPVVFMAYDMLESGGDDIRQRPLAERRGLLEQAIGGGEGVLRVSAEVQAESWDTLAALRTNSRALGVEGLMIKRRTSPYGVGRKRGEWWKWKIDPYSIDAVLIYAQPGSGKRASLLTDYTFGVWHEGALVPIAKAYSGLSNEEIAEMDRWIRRHTRERFGPVRHVEPVQVFELGFEGIAESSRTSLGDCRPLPSHASLAQRQEARGRRHPRDGSITALDRSAAREKVAQQQQKRRILVAKPYPPRYNFADPAKLRRSECTCRVVEPVRSASRLWFVCRWLARAPVRAARPNPRRQINRPQRCAVLSSRP